MNFSFDAPSLKRWFLEAQRDLPWRLNRTPYSVWVSEIMLQQTQVSVVIPYYERWMQKFPTIEALAQAPLHDVIKLWEGLGYYSRARNLHEGARYVLEKHGGVLPPHKEELLKIKGLGPYTVGAICSFAFQQKMGAVDGNVVRVLTRYFHLTEDISKPKTITFLRNLANHILPDVEPWIINEGLIELGALICTRQPKCPQCPLNKSCQAFAKGNIDKIPVKTKKIQIEYLHRTVVIIQWKDQFLVRQCQKNEIMESLYEFPFFENADVVKKTVEEEIKARFNCSVFYHSEMTTVTHSFTRFQAKLTPLKFMVKDKIQPHVDGYQWFKLNELNQLPFSSGHRRILREL